MSENEFDVQRDRAEEDRENVVLTGEEIELPGEDSDASAIIGESSEPIHTGEIEAVAIGGLTGRVPAAAPLKPTIEDKISTGELPVVTAPEGDLPVVSPRDEADAAPEETQEHADGEQEAPKQDSSEVVAATDESVNEDEGADGAEDTAEVSSDDSADAVSEEVADQQEEPAEDNAPANEEPTSEQADEEDAPSQDAAPEAEQTDDASDEVETIDDPEPTLVPVMTPAQAAAAMGLSTDDAAEKAEEADDSTDEPATDDADAAHEAEESAVGGAAAEHTLTSRRSMIFGDDDDATSPSIPALTPVEQDETASSDEAEDPSAELDLPTEEATPFTEPTTQLPTQDAQASYSFEDQDAAEEARPRRRSLLGEGDEDSEAATLAAIASTAARGDKAESPRLDDELFSAAPEITEMPSRTGAHWLSLLLFLLLVPAGWYLAADAGARMTLADAAPMYTGVASIVALGELLGTTLISAILFVTARRSSLGAWLMGLVTLVVGLPWVMAPGITAASALTALTALTNTGSLGANLSHHLQASGYSGRFALLGIALLGLAYVSHSARRTGREEEALRTSIEAINPAGAFYSKRARKKAAKDAARK
ncbi:MAG: hypothetical protein E7E22_06745 [Actinomyces sp.]|nr:hypothetical protein [Actinomyces sp.]